MAKLVGKLVGPASAEELLAMFEELCRLDADRLVRVTPEAAGRAARRAGPCGCECCRGGFCGGCGHAGCGRR